MARVPERKASWVWVDLTATELDLFPHNSVNATLLLGVGAHPQTLHSDMFRKHGFAMKVGGRANSFSSSLSRVHDPHGDVLTVSPLTIVLRLGRSL